jgi:hypothetical protein
MTEPARRLRSPTGCAAYRQNQPREAVGCIHGARAPDCRPASCTGTATAASHTSPGIDLAAVGPPERRGPDSAVPTPREDSGRASGVLMREDSCPAAARTPGARQRRTRHRPGPGTRRPGRATRRPLDRRPRPGQRTAPPGLRGHDTRREPCRPGNGPRLGGRGHRERIGRKRATRSVLARARHALGLSALGDGGISSRNQLRDQIDQASAERDDLLQGLT